MAILLRTAVSAPTAVHLQSLDDYLYGSKLGSPGDNPDDFGIYPDDYGLFADDYSLFPEELDALFMEDFGAKIPQTKQEIDDVQEPEFYNYFFRYTCLL